jgi:hypothetical protein
LPLLQLAPPEAAEGQRTDALLSGTGLTPQP